MKGVISNFRGGKHTVHHSQMIVVLKDADRAKAEKLIGKNVVWKTPSNKEVKGTITSTHGSKGSVRVKFEKECPASLWNAVSIES